MFRQCLNCVLKVSDTGQSLTETEQPLNISVALSVEFADGGRLAEGRVQHLN